MAVSRPALDGTYQQMPDGTWSPAEPEPVTYDFDVEVTGTGPFEWEAWVGMKCVASGGARTRLGLQVSLLRAKRKHAALIGRAVNTPADIPEGDDSV